MFKWLHNDLSNTILFLVTIFVDVYSMFGVPVTAWDWRFYGGNYEGNDVLVCAAVVTFVEAASKLTFLWKIDKH
jgi:hypothetical protein